MNNNGFPENSEQNTNEAQLILKKQMLKTMAAILLNHNEISQDKYLNMISDFDRIKS